MQYRKNKTGEPISLLGYGCMRLTKNGRNIDIDKAEKEIKAAFDAGVNYYDTAYVYPGNEEALGEVVKRLGIRKKINIATKLPQYLVRSAARIDKYFDESLRRLQTDYIDYFLFHFVTDLGQWRKLLDLGIEKWIERKKAAGEIRNIGFSYHGNTEEFLKVLNAYEWDFCQIQYNYIDEHSQAGLAGLKAAAARGIPVVIMEPLRGGKLVNLLPDEAKELIRNSEKGYTPAELAFRWLYNQPEVTCVLSGMNSMEMVEENCRVASDAEAGSFTLKDQELINQVKKIITASEKVGCTGCRYCMPCPKGVDIPTAFKSYNQLAISKKFSTRVDYIQQTGLRKQTSFASQCVGCGKCESHCPQDIPIRQKLKEADRALLPFPYKIGVKIARRFMLGKN